MLMRNRLMLMAAVATALAAGTAQAAPDFGDMFRFNAYGTLGVVHSNQDQADYVSTQSEQPDGAGYSRSWSPNVDSRLAAQVTAQFTEKLTGVIQLVSEDQQNQSWTGKPNPRYRPSLEWANLKYDFSDHWSVRAGRMVLPAFMLSEYRNIGYALPFIRSPLEVYNIPFTNVDGGEVSYRHSIGSATNTITAVAGATSVRTTSAAIGAQQSRLYMLIDKLEVGSLSVFYSYIHNPVKAPVGFGDLFTQFAQAAAQVPGGTAAADTAYGLDRRYNYGNWGNVEITDLGATYDPGNWFVMGEVTAYWNNGVIGSAKEGYLTAGYRTHGLTPYATYARMVTHYSPAASIPLGGLPPDLADYGDMLNGIAQGIAATNNSQRTLTAGLRWDFMKNLDLKVQYDYVTTDAGSTGMFANIQPGFRPGSSASVFGLTVDFVY